MLCKRNQDAEREIVSIVVTIMQRFRATMLVVMQIKIVEKEEEERKVVPRGDEVKSARLFLGPKAQDHLSHRMNIWTSSSASSPFFA